jgi:hypothetical protein
MTARTRAMATFGLVLRGKRCGPWRCFTPRRGRIIRTGVDNSTGVGLIATGCTRGQCLLRGGRRGLKRLAKEHAAKPAHRDLSLLQGKHQPQTRAKHLPQAPCHRRWQITLMHVSHQALDLFATQRYVFRWLLHPSSFETQTDACHRDGGDVTVAWQLVKPSRSSRSPRVVRMTASGVGRWTPILWLRGGDGPVRAWEVKTTRIKSPSEA